jgi:hypothetical protein
LTTIGEIGTHGLRVACPYNRDHIVWDSRLVKHTAKCPNKNIAPKYVTRGVKRKSSIDDTNATKTVPPKVPLPDDATLRTFQRRVLMTISKCELLQSWPLPLQQLQHASFTSLFGTERKQIKHITQESSMIAHMQHAHMLPIATSTPPSSSDSSPPPSSSSSSSSVAPLFVEFGAGTGGLSRHIQQACNHETHHLMIDRMNFRTGAKVDRMMKLHAKLGYHIHRVEADIDQVTLDSLPYVMDDSKRARPIVAIGKHLCGGATDLTLRVLLGLHQPTAPTTATWTVSSASSMASTIATPPSPSTKSVSSSSSPTGAAVPPPSIKRPLHVAIATCCHHLCTSDAFVTPFTFNVGNNAEKSTIDGKIDEWTTADFALLTRLSGWATLKLESDDTNDNDDDNEHKPIDDDNDSDSRVNSHNDTKSDVPPSDTGDKKSRMSTSSLPLSRMEKFELGRAAKLLLDSARAFWLQQHGFTTSLVCYTNQSKENTLLLASRP